MPIPRLNVLNAVSIAYEKWGKFLNFPCGSLKWVAELKVLSTSFSSCTLFMRKSKNMLTLKGQRPTSRSDSVETDLLLWWEDFYLPIFEYVLPKMGQLEGKTVLELGTGTGGTATLLAKRGASVVGIDLLPLPTH